VAEPFACVPTDVAKLPGAITVMAPERAQPDPVWSVLWRPFDGGATTWAGNESRFRTQMLTEAIRKWFISQKWLSFEREHPSERLNPFNRIDRPSFNRELICRHEWRLTEIAPDLFEDHFVEKQRARDAAQKVYEEMRHRRSYRGKREDLAAIHELERKILPNSGVSEEERQAAREEYKRKFGFTAAVKAQPIPPHSHRQRHSLNSSTGLVHR
jgi:hypothetical protein